MSHAAHFLSRLDRTCGEETDFALSLYRDAELVCRLLRRLDLVGSSERRVGLSLVPGDQGPWIVVTAQGDFVTCLAAGMVREGMAEVPHERLRWALEREGLLRRRCRQALGGPHPASGGLAALTGAVVASGDRASQEQILTLAAMQPVLACHAGLKAWDSWDRLEESRGRQFEAGRNRKHAEEQQFLEAAAKVFWGVGDFLRLAAWSGPTPIRPILEVLAGSGAPFATPLHAMGDVRSVMQAAWCAGRLGEADLPNLRLCLMKEHLLGHLQGLLGMLVVALRHPALRPSIEGQVRDFGLFPRDEPELARLCGPLIRTLVPRLLAEPVEVGGVFLALAQRRVWEDHLGGGLRLPEAARWARPTDVPADWARAYLMHELWATPVCSAAGLELALLASPWLAVAQGEDLYLPQAVLDARPARHPAHERYFGALACSRLLRRDLLPLQAPPRPGRNEPCDCGSGRKFKHCCLDKQACAVG